MWVVCCFGLYFVIDGVNLLSLFFLFFLYVVVMFFFVIVNVEMLWFELFEFDVDLICWFMIMLLFEDLFECVLVSGIDMFDFGI